MGRIDLKNIRVYAYHGCLKEETAIGSDYLVQLSVEADLSKASISDDLTDTVDYVDLNAIVKQEMMIPAKLLEFVAKRIVDRVFNEHSLVTKISVEVEKMNPPIGGDVQAVSVILTKSR
jgi:dihydroneopterin aldolase